MSGEIDVSEYEAARPPSERIKIFVWGDPSDCCDWIAAKNPEDAKRGWHETIEGDEYEGDPVEVPDEELDKLMFRPDDGPAITFRQHLKNLMNEGQEFPVYFASSDF